MTTRRRSLHIGLPMSPEWARYSSVWVTASTVVSDRDSVLKPKKRGKLRRTLTVLILVGVLLVLAVSPALAHGNTTHVMVWLMHPT